MQYKVPQNVQREDTIIGPLTLKQMIILGIGGGISYAIYISLSKTYFMEVWLPPVVIISGITLAFTFLKIHSLPFHEFLMNFIEYHLLPRQRSWIQGTGVFIPPFDDNKKKEEVSQIISPTKSNKSLQELTKVVDTPDESETEEKELTASERKEQLDQLINQNYNK